MVSISMTRRVPIVASAAALLAALIGLAGLIVPSVAQAAQVDGITKVTVIDPADGVDVFDTLTLEAAWAAPASAQPGDTFALDFPTSPLLVGIASTFDMKDPDGAVIGTCIVTSTGIECTLSDYVSTHTNVQGTIQFQARIMEENGSGELPFATGSGGVIVAQIPGGGVGPGQTQPAPADAVKSGVVTVQGDAIEWYVWVPGAKLAGANPSVTDDYASRLTFLPESLSVGSVHVTDWNGGNFAPGSFAPLTTPDGYTLSQDAAASSFAVNFVGTVQPDRLYRIMYQTKLPADVKTGDVFDNTVTGSTFTETTSTVKVTRAGGEGNGDGLGDFSIAKTVSGDAAASVPAGQTFVVDYSYNAGGNSVTGSLTLTAGGSVQSVGDIPVGTVVTVKERPATAVGGVIWGAPQFGGAGVRPIDGGAELTISDASTIAVALTNPAESVPPILGGFSIAKEVTGGGAGTVPADLTFEVEYSYDLDGARKSGVVEVRAKGEAQVIDGIPAGTVVTLKERTPASVTGVTWGTPGYTGQGVTSTSDGAQLTIVEGADVGLVVVNPATPVPPTPSVPPTPPVPSTPSVPPTPPVPATPNTGTTLAITGGAGVTALAIGALGIAGTGAGLLLLRRRQATME